MAAAAAAAEYGMLECTHTVMLNYLSVSMYDRIILGGNNVSITFNT